MDIWIRGPCEPEEADGENYSAENHGWKTGFGDKGLFGSEEFGVEAQFCVEGDVDAA